MATVVIVGAQWGDEGKGKVTDYLAQGADLVVRSQGGNNAGHTVVVGERIYKLHIVPSGIFYTGCLAVIGNGVVVDPAVLVQEMDYLLGEGVSLEGLRISDRAHLIMPYHVAQDALEEEGRGERKIGTTRRGIGPAYMDKDARMGLRVVDLTDPEEFRYRLRHALETKNHFLAQVYGGAPFSEEEVYRAYMGYAERLAPFITDTTVLVNEAIDQGRKVLFEGAQGTLLDIDYGTYPYVTSSHPVAGGVTIGAGVGPTRIDRVLGVVKAYTSRVGDGPFPTELFGELGDYIRDRGGEYGTTTGRPRRCGWLDAVMLRHAVRVNGISSFAVNHLDTLGGLPTVRVAVAYRHPRLGELTGFPASLKVLGECEPVYEEMAGWSGDGLAGVRNLADLPSAARHYLQRVGELTGCGVSLVSLGRERSAMLPLEPIF